MVNFWVKAKMDLKCTPNKVKILTSIIFKPTHKRKFMGKLYGNFKVCLTILNVLSRSKCLCCTIIKCLANKLIYSIFTLENFK